MPKRRSQTSSGFGGRLRSLRETCGWTQAELAGRSDLAKDSIARMERGIHEPSWPVALALARALGVGVGSFVGETDGVVDCPLSEKARALLVRLKERHGVSEADVIEMALRRMARVDLSEGGWPPAAVLDAASALVEKRASR